MGFVLRCITFCCVYGIALSAGHDVFLNPTGSRQPDICSPAPPGGVEWIWHIREPNYGWNEHTHRAVIALAVNGWNGRSEDDISKVKLQLEEEVTNALLRNSTSLIEDHDLALFIHALIATRKNPRNFHGIDLVADLLHRVEYDAKVHPFLVLALVNSHSVEFHHLEKIKEYALHREGNRTLDTREAEMKAIALKAFACAAGLPDARKRQLDKYGGVMEVAAKCLISKQVDGIFGNAYTTSLAVQALTAYGVKIADWKEAKSLDFLRKESEIEVNIIKAYYIELALNARRVNCINNLYGGPYDPEVTEPPTSSYFTTYTIKDEQDPDIYFSVVMKIPQGWNFFQVMEKAAELSNRFKFSHVLNPNKEPMVYQVIGKPNDAEENLFWTICRQRNIQHDPHTSNITTHSSSPVQLTPAQKEHIILWYRSTECPPA